MANTCREAIGEVFTNVSDVLDTGQVIDRLYARYPHRPWKMSSISAHLVGLSVNHLSSIHHPHLRRYGFLFSLGNGRYRNWSRAQDGDWEVRNGRVQRVGKPEVAIEEPKPIPKDVVTLDDLTRWRRNLIRMLNKIDSDSSTEGVVTKIKRLSHLGRIAREIAPFMIAVVEMRNVGEYQDKILSHAESEATRHAWTAIVEWARAQGIEFGL
jgi:hypothetical protein